MANNNAPTGFSFVRNFVSGAPTYQTSVYQIASNNANSFGKGDVVKALTTGYIDRALTSDTLFLGIIDRVEYFDTAIGKQFRNSWTAPSTALAGSVIAYVIDDPNAVFGVQSGGSTTTAVVQTDTFTNINFGGNAAPNSRTGISTAYADQTTINPATTTLPFRIVNVPQNLGGVPVTAAPIGNDSASPYNYIEVIGNAWNATSRTGV